MSRALYSLPLSIDKTHTINGMIYINDELYNSTIHDVYYFQENMTIEEKIEASKKRIAELIGPEILDCELYAVGTVPQGELDKRGLGIIERMMNKKVTYYDDLPYSGCENSVLYSGNTLLLKTNRNSRYAFILGGKSSGYTEGYGYNYFSSSNGSVSVSDVSPIMLRYMDGDERSVHGDSDLYISVHKSSFIKNNKIDTSSLSDRQMVLHIDATGLVDSNRLTISSYLYNYKYNERYKNSSNGLEVTLISGGIDPTPSSDNPYNQLDDDHKEGGENATLDWSSDVIEDTYTPGMPAQTILNMYSCVDGSPLAELRTKMWNNTSLIDLFKYSSSNVLSGIISLHKVPFTPQTDPVNKVKIGSQNFEFSEGTFRALVTTASEIDMGDVVIPRFYDGYLDYAPYTTISIFLPFIGEISRDTDMVMGKTLHLKYNFDAISGNCVAILSTEDGVIGQYNGNSIVTLPMTSVDHSQILAGYAMVAGGVASIVGSAAMAVATSGAMGGKAPVTLAGEAGNAGNAGTYIKSAGGILGGAASIAKGVSDINNPQVKHTGGLSGSFGFLGLRQPYVLIKSPKLVKTKNDQTFIGGSQWKAGKVGEFKGYTEFKEVHLENISASSSEKDMIINELLRGVIL